MTAAATTPDWISALSTLLLGIVGTLFAAYQYWASGFRPDAQVLLAVRRDSLRVRIWNRGRAEGTVHGLDVVDRNSRVLEVPRAGAFFEPFPLQPGSARVLDFNAPEGRDFAHDDLIVVAWGAKELRRRPLPTQVSFYKDDEEEDGPGP